MAHFPKADPHQRAPRSKLSIPTQIVLTYDDGRRTLGRLQTVSETGGCAGLEAQLAPATLVSVEMRTTAGPITAIAEMLRPLDPTRQPFRFIAMDESDRGRLQQIMKS